MSYEYEKVATPSTGLRLHLNENTAGCSPKVLDALHALTREQAAYYPDYDAAIEAVSTRFGVAADTLLLTNGLDEGILAAAIAALRMNAADGPPEAIVIVPAFDMYAACADVAGGRVVQVSLDEGFAFSTPRVLQAITPRTKLIFLTNPNNPTGQVIPAESVLTVARSVPGALVFVDEAYADFAGETLIGDPRLSDLPNVIVGRTFAKVYGLAALRAGAVFGDAETLAPLRRVVPPYSINVCAAIALPVALGDTAYYDWYLDQVAQSKTLLYQTFDRLRIRYWTSAANFVLADVGVHVARVVDALAARNVHVRDRSRDPGCAGCVRITTGVLEHTRTCVEALEEVMCGAA
jgi:histidinol-phosphate aminotransferase